MGGICHRTPISTPRRELRLAALLDPMTAPSTGAWVTNSTREIGHPGDASGGVSSGFFPGATDRSSMPVGGIFLGNEMGSRGPLLAERPQHTPGPEPSLGGGTSGLAPGGPIETPRNSGSCGAGTPSPSDPGGGKGRPPDMVRRGRFFAKSVR